MFEFIEKWFAKRNSIAQLKAAGYKVGDDDIPTVSREHSSSFYRCAYCREYTFSILQQYYRVSPLNNKKHYYYGDIISHGAIHNLDADNDEFMKKMFGEDYATRKRRKPMYYPPKYGRCICLECGIVTDFWGCKHTEMSIDSFIEEMEEYY